MNFDKSLEIIKKAMVMKKHMINKKLIRAKAKCPYCAGYWQGQLNGPKQHLWFRCDGDCGAMLMQ